MQSTGRIYDVVMRDENLYDAVSPANGLGRQGVDLAVLVNRDHISLLRVSPGEPAQREVEAVPAHDHGLKTGPRFNPEALGCAPGEGGVGSGGSGKPLWLISA